MLRAKPVNDVSLHLIRLLLRKIHLSRLRARSENGSNSPPDCYSLPFSPLRYPPRGRLGKKLCVFLCVKRNAFHPAPCGLGQKVALTVHWGVIHYRFLRSATLRSKGKAWEARRARELRRGASDMCPFIKGRRYLPAASDMPHKSVAYLHFVWYTTDEVREC